jgi:hypothetical protein
MWKIIKNSIKISKAVWLLKSVWDDCSTHEVKQHLTKIINKIKN